MSGRDVSIITYARLLDSRFRPWSALLHARGEIDSLYCHVRTMEGYVLGNTQLDVDDLRTLD